MNKDEIKILENFRVDAPLRNSFFELVKEVFPRYDFQSWHKSGYWTDNYIPHSIVENGRVISNVSASKMKILLKGKLINCIQLGTVCTANDFLKQGLSKILMDYVIDKYNSKADFFFLYANDEVLNFYPKFGFRRHFETLYKCSTNLPSQNFSARKLNINTSGDFQLIEDLLKQRSELTKIFGAIDYGFITVWHLINIFHDNIFYLENEKAMIIKTEENNELHIWEVIHTEDFDLAASLPKVIESGKFDSIVYHFPPDQLSFKFDETIPDAETIFFVRGDFELEGSKYKLPITAQT